MSEAGKDSSARQFTVLHQKFADNLPRIFGSMEHPPSGVQRITPAGKLEEYREGYWIEIENRR